MTSIEAQERLFGVLKEYKVRLKDNGTVEQGDEEDMFVLSAAAGEILEFGENNRYRVTGVAPQGDTPAGLVLKDTKTKDRISVTKKGHAPQKTVDFFSKLSDDGKVSADLIARINHSDINKAGLFLIPMFEEALNIKIPGEERVNYIQRLNSELSSSNPQMVKDIQAVIKSEKSLDKEIVDRVLENPDQHLFKTVLLVRKAISDKKNAQQAFNSLQSFARNLKKLIAQNKKDEAAEVSRLDAVIKKAKGDD